MVSSGRGRQAPLSPETARVPPLLSSSPLSLPPCTSPPACSLHMLSPARCQGAMTWTDPGDRKTYEFHPHPRGGMGEASGGEAAIICPFLTWKSRKSLRGVGQSLHFSCDAHTFLDVQNG